MLVHKGFGIYGNCMGTGVKICVVLTPLCTSTKKKGLGMLIAKLEDGDGDVWIHTPGTSDARCLRTTIPIPCVVPQTLYCCAATSISPAFLFEAVEFSPNRSHLAYPPTTLTKWHLCPALSASTFTLGCSHTLFLLSKDQTSSNNWIPKLNSITLNMIMRCWLSSLGELYFCKSYGPGTGWYISHSIHGNKHWVMKAGSVTTTPGPDSFWACNVKPLFLLIWQTTAACVVGMQRKAKALLSHGLTQS